MVTVTKMYDLDDDITFIFNALVYCCSEGSKYFYIYGGVPRDLIRGVPYEDIDIFIRDEKNVQLFVSFLKRANRLRKEIEIRNDGYCSTTLEIQTNSSTKYCLLDITSDRSNSYESKTLPVCDFACNNLVITREGHISTRARSIHHSPPLDCPINWTSRCIRDALEGKLTWMVPDTLVKRMGPKEYTTFCTKMNERRDKMVKKGFNSITDSFGLFNGQCLKGYQYANDDLCAICKEIYTEKPDKTTLVLGCTHHFHIDCVDNWVTSGRYHISCPVCRAAIELRYEKHENDIIND